jgi:hypothetical protein
MTVGAPEPGSALDRAILAFQDDPTTANRDAVLAAQEQHALDFYAELAAEYQDRTRSDHGR